MVSHLYEENSIHSLHSPLRPRQCLSSGKVYMLQSALYLLITTNVSMIPRWIHMISDWTHTGRLSEVCHYILITCVDFRQFHMAVSASCFIAFAT